MHIGRLGQTVFFSIRLFLSITPTLVKFSLIPIAHSIHLVLAIGFLVVALVFMLLKPQLRPYLSSFYPQPEPVTSFEVIDKEIAYWEKLRTLQPSHRDVLINLSLLYQAKGETTRAQDFRDQAQKIDPNHPFFASPTP